MSLYHELKRRNVLRVGIAYIVTAWLIIQVVETLFPVFGFGNESIRSVVIVLAIGLVPVLFFAWAFEFTPEGLKREKDVDRSHSITPATGKKLDRWVILLLAVALSYFAFDKFILDPARDADLVDATAHITEQAVLNRTPEKSIAVLPFSDFSPEGDHRYFSNGLAEELLNLLARVPGLRVTSRTSSFTFADKVVDIPGIASALNVAYILEGSVQIIDNRIRVTAQLIDTEKDAHVWSETYDRQMVDIFSMQDEIAALVIDSLQISLASDAPLSTPTDPKAFAIYLQARHLWRQGSVEGIESAFQKLQEVLALDSMYAPAWEGLSTVYTYQVDTGALSFEEGYSKARDAARRALEIDPDYALAHSHLGWDAMIFGGDYEAAATHFRNARRLAPNNPAILGNSATLAAVIGRPNDAIDLVSKAISFDPIDSASYTNLGAFYMAANQFDNADTAIAKALELSPGDIWAKQAIVYLRILQGRPEDALMAYENMDTNSSQLVMLSMIYHDLEQWAEAGNALSEFERLHADDSALLIAENYAWQGKFDDSFAWLQRAFDEGQSIQFIRTSAFFRNMETDPRWEEILSRLGLANDQVSDIEL